MCFFKLPSVKKFFPQKSNFFLHVFFVCDSSNCLRPEKFSHKSCNFFFVCFSVVILQIAFGLKNFPTKIALFSSYVLFMCFFKLPLVRNIFHKNCTLFFMCFCMCFFELPVVRNIFPQKLQFFFLFYVILQIAFGLKDFPTKVALFSSCVFCRCFFKLPLVRNIFPQNMQFFLHVFLYVFLQIAFGPKYFPTKIAIFTSCVFGMCFFKLPLVRNIFPQKLHFFLHVFFVYVSSNCLWSKTFSSCFFYVILQIAYGLKNFPSKVALFSSCVFVCVFSNCLRPGNFSHRVCT